jgi:hypothetical protein
MIYRRSIQVGAGIEWERRLTHRNGWASVYGSVGAGWREERIFGDDDRLGEHSDSVSRGVALVGLGARFDAGELFSGLNYRIQLGLTGWVPFSDATLQMSGEEFRVQRPTLALSLGLSFGLDLHQTICNVLKTCSNIPYHLCRYRNGRNHVKR